MPQEFEIKRERRRKTNKTRIAFRNEACRRKSENPWASFSPRNSSFPRGTSIIARVSRGSVYKELILYLQRELKRRKSSVAMPDTAGTGMNWNAWNLPRIVFTTQLVAEMRINGILEIYINLSWQNFNFPSYPIVFLTIILRLIEDYISNGNNNWKEYEIQ